MKNSLKNSFNKFAKPFAIGCASAGAAHIGCIVLPLTLGVLGGSLGALPMAGFMLLAAPALSVGVLYTMNRHKGKETRFKQAFAAASLALTVSAGLQAYGHIQNQSAPTQQTEFNMDEFIKNMPMCGGNRS